MLVGALLATWMSLLNDAGKMQRGRLLVVYILLNRVRLTLMTAWTGVGKFNGVILLTVKSAVVWMLLVAVPLSDVILTSVVIPVALI